MQALAKYVDIDDLKGLPSEFLETFKWCNMRGKGYPFWNLKGDTNAFFALFFDNLATQLTLVGIAVGVVGFTPAFVYSHFMGGVGLSILAGNIYYSLQASKVATRTGKTDVCAQPYGVNTPGALGKSFNILLPAFMAAVASECGGSATECTEDQLERVMVKAWSAACAANFIGGLLEFSGAFLVTLLFKIVPYGAMLIPIGGVGFTWLGYSPFAQMFGSHTADFPIVGIIPFLIVFLSFFASPRVTGPVPSVLFAAIIGIFLFLMVDADGYAKEFDTAKTYVGKGGLHFPDLSYGFSTLSSSSSYVAAFAFTNFLGTYACNIQARVGGDIFSPMESMMVDGLGSMIGALFGSPYGTTVYLGHTTYKKFGATRGYSVLNGVMFFIMGLTGLHAIADAILPNEIVLGVLVCIGFLITAQCVEVVPPRWVPAVMVGLAICWSDYMLLQGADNNLGPGNDITILAGSYVWVALLWTFVLMMLIDRWFVSAGIIFLVMAFLTTFGVMHSTKIGAEYIDGHHFGAPVDTTKTWKIIVTYALSSGVMLVYSILQKYGYVPAAEQEDFRIIQAEKFSAPGKRDDVYDVPPTSKSTEIEVEKFSATGKRDEASSASTLPTPV